MPITRARPTGSMKTFKIPCSGEGIFVSVNQGYGDGAGCVIYWNGTEMKLMTGTLNCEIKSITVQDGVATVIVYNGSGNYDELARVCFIPGNPLTSN